MKNFLFVLSCILLVGTFSYGQTSAKEEAGSLTKKLSKELKLSGKQAQQLNKVLIASFEEAEIVRKNTALTKEIRKQKLNSIYAARTSEMNAIFDESQKAKYEQFKKNHDPKSL